MGNPHVIMDTLPTQVSAEDGEQAIDETHRLASL